MRGIPYPIGDEMLKETILRMSRSGYINVSELKKLGIDVI
jgi:hypothetical protein